MLNAQAICKLILDDELPPSDAGEDQYSDIDDPEKTLKRYASEPFKLRGSPVDLYHKFKSLLRGKKSKRIPGIRSTWVEDIDGMLALRFHETDVLRVTPENRVIVTMGGWHTTTTAGRINEWNPGGWRLFGKKPRVEAHDTWTFYWYHAGNGIGCAGDTRRFPYTDGDEIYPDGTLVMQANPVYKVK